MKGLIFSIFILTSASLRAQTPVSQLAAADMAAGGMFPKGTYTFSFDDGPGPMTLDIAEYLQSLGIKATFFEVSCHYSGETADPRSSLCKSPANVPKSLLEGIGNAGQCVGSHTSDHLSLTGISIADALGQISKPIDIFKPVIAPDCPFLFVAPGQQWTAALAAAANANPAISGQMQGPIGDDFDGSGTIGGTVIPQDQACMVQFSVQQCGQLYLNAMNASARGGIIVVHDYTPFAPGPMDRSDPRSNYALALVKAIVEGCSKCTFISPGAIPGIQANPGMASFQKTSDNSDNLSVNAAPVIVGDINSDGKDDIIVPRQNGIYCGLTAPDGRQYPLYLCMPLTEPGPANRRYWLADIQVDGLPWLVWIDSSRGMLGAKSDGKGYFGQTQLLAHIFAGLKVRAIAFGHIRKTTVLPDAVLMTDRGVAISLNNGHGQFGVPKLLPSLAHISQPDSAWEPEQSETGFMLVDVNGDGLADIVMPGTFSMLRAINPGGGNFGAFTPLLGNDGFNHWANPSQGYWTSFSATTIAGENAIVGWAPNGIAYAVIDPPVAQQAVIPAKGPKSGWLCNECFVGLYGWMASWQASPVNLINQVGFADFLGDGRTPPQPWLIWQGALYTAQ